LYAADDGVSKSDQKRTLFERSEFRSFPDLDAAAAGTPKGLRTCGRLLLLTFLGEARKVSSRRAIPGIPSLFEELQ